jgi:hypothetical protein
VPDVPICLLTDARAMFKRAANKKIHLAIHF